eukprot:5617109-Pyramimonas_sp.AAC.1
MAEVAGCRAGLALLPHLSSPFWAARVVGDNLAAMRCGAGTARYRTLHLAQQMEDALGQAENAGWVLTWRAVRRRLNRVADSLATIGVYWADALLSEGETTVRACIRWVGTAP